MKKGTIVVIIVAIALLAVIKIVFLKKDDGASAKPAAGGAQKMPPALVTVYVTNSQILENSLYSSGTILANEEVDLHPETAGKIISILFKEGSIVQKGQLLVKINDADLQAQLKKSSLNYDLSKQKEGRLKELLAIKGVSQEDYDVAANELQTITADMDYTRALIAKTEIRAPFDGTVGLKNVSEGSYVGPTDIIASMQQIDPVKVDFSVPEKYSSKIHLNDTVIVSIEGTGEKHKGLVYAFDPKIDANTRALKVRALINNHDRKIFPGSFAQISTVLKTEKSVVVPTMAVIPNLRGQSTFVVKDGKANLTPITIGIRTDTTVEVLTGLNAGDTVVTSGIMTLKTGMQVKIQSPKKNK
ncbi:MAG: efflux transporter, family, subunit [Bacteroidetes bacterium]|nr:efflux transporter, family, subunit [Bacteroidota bacterium]